MSIGDDIESAVHDSLGERDRPAPQCGFCGGGMDHIRICSACRRRYLPSKSQAKRIAEQKGEPWPSESTAGRPREEEGDGMKARTMWVCPECGPRVAADEDGCCASCGADCVCRAATYEAAGRLAQGPSEDVENYGPREEWKAAALALRERVEKLAGALERACAVAEDAHAGAGDVWDEDTTRWFSDALMKVLNIARAALSDEAPPA